MTVVRTIGRNTAFNVVGRIAQMAVWILVTPVALARLGPEQFGYWALLLSIGGAVTLVDLGVGAAVVTYISRGRAAADGSSARRIVARALVVYLLLAGALAIGALIATPWVLSAFHVDAAWRDQARISYWCAVAAFLMAGVANVFQSALTGLQRLDLASGTALVLSPIALLAIRSGLASATPLLGLVAAQLGFNLVLALVLAIVFVRQRETRAGTAGIAPTTAELLRFGGLMQIAALAGFFHLQVDKLLLGRISGLASVAPYELGFRVSSAVTMLPTLALAAFLPAAAEHEIRTAGQARDRLYQRAILPYLSIVLLLAAAPVALADPLYHAWLGAAHPDAALALRILVMSSSLTVFTGIATSLARAIGVPKYESLYGVLALALHVPLSIIGLRLLGWVGAPLGGLVAVTVTTVWFLVTVERKLAIPAWSATARALVTLMPPTLLATGATWGMLQLWPGEGRAQAFGRLVFGGLLFVGSFGGSLLLLIPGARTWAQRSRMVGP